MALVCRSRVPSDAKSRGFAAGGEAAGACVAFETTF